MQDAQIKNPNSIRWKKKKDSIRELSNNSQCLRLNISRDIEDTDEKTALTALVIAVMDRSAERIGNADSADNGHFGVTGFQKKHIHVIGNKVHLNYVGKSGMKHEKSFSDERIAKALKKAIKNSPSKFIFETSDGFRIRSDKVNRYLEPFNISSKDLRGYNANRWIIDKLNKQNIPSDSKERKKIFNKAIKETALRVGHGTGTLKKHYLIPELQYEYIEHGKIIDIKTLNMKKNKCAFISTGKKKIQERIDILENSKKSASEEAKNAIQKKIDKLQEQMDYKPTAKERAQANQGKFAMDVPSGMSKAIYKKLWSMKIFPKIHKLNGTSSIVVDSGTNLNAAYKVYSDIADKKVPALSKISRKL